jgi:hypothetical protein
MKTAAQSTTNSCARFAEKWAAQAASRKTRFFAFKTRFLTRLLTRSEEFSQKRIRPSIAAIAAFSAKASGLCARKYESCKRSYLRWADEFTHRPARIAAGPTSAKAKHSTIHPSRRQFLKARFLR